MRNFQRTEVISTLDWNLYLHLKVFDISEHENEMRVFHTSVIHRYICNNSDYKLVDIKKTLRCASRSGFVR